MCEKYNIKEFQRENEILHYQREMFWHELEKQRLIAELLKKIYQLQDEIEVLKTKCSNQQQNICLE